MSFCPNCGRQVSDDASFCPSCGATIKPAAAGGAAPQTPPVTPPVQPPGPPVGAQPPYTQPPFGVPPSSVPGVQPPPPVRKKGSGWKIAIVVGLVVILLIAVVVTLIAVFVFKTVTAPVDVTNRYIEAINDGDAEEAWDLLHPDSPLKEDYDLSSFESEIIGTSVRLRTWNANEVEIKDSRAEVRVNMEDTSGEEFRIIFELRKDGDEWKILDYGSLSE
jgi:uncharacterized protein YxeA